MTYGITIGTIDGKSTGPLHSPCAVIFFVILVICIITVSIYLTKLRSYDTRTMGYWSLKSKQILATYVGFVWVYCIYGLATASSLEGKGDKFVVIV